MAGAALGDVGAFTKATLIDAQVDLKQDVLDLIRDGQVIVRVGQETFDSQSVPDLAAIIYNFGAQIEGKIGTQNPVWPGVKNGQLVRKDTAISPTSNQFVLNMSNVVAALLDSVLRSIQTRASRRSSAFSDDFDIRFSSHKPPVAKNWGSLQWIANNKIDALGYITELVSRLNTSGVVSRTANFNSIVRARKDHADAFSAFCRTFL